MKEEAKYDVIPALIIFLITVLLSDAKWMSVLTAFPLVFFALYWLNLIHPKEMYTPKPRKKGGFWNEMYNYSHPILMPKPLYALLGIVYMVFGTVLFLFYPINLYFWNWGSICFKMSSASSQTAVVPDLPARPASKPAAASKPRKQSTKKAKASGIPIPTPKAKSWSNASRQEKLNAAIEKNVILQIEKNDQELQNVQLTFKQALDTIFGGSKLTKARFQDGMDKAVEMSAKNLDAAKDYVKIGHNPEVLQKFLNRSNRINQETGELLDALVAHQQNQMEDNLKGLSDSLDELQDSLRYYH